MLVSKILFNLLAVALFVIIFFKMIKKNDTTYVSILIAEAIGIGINFIEIIGNLYGSVVLEIIEYVLAVIIPIIVIIMEAKGINFSEIINMIETRRQNAYKKVNEELISLYWDFGKYISEKVNDNMTRR